MSTTTDNTQDNTAQLDEVIHRFDYQEILLHLKDKEQSAQQLVQYRLWNLAKQMRQWGLTLDEIEEMLDNVFVKTKQIIMDDVEVM